MPENTDSAEIIKLAQGHIAILIGRNWPAISELLDESEEVNLSAKIVITERTPEAGEHSDVDHRVKTTISFSKKVSDSTESALEDPNNEPLKCPHDKTLDEFCQECADEEKARQSAVFVPEPVNPERFPETGDSAAEVRKAKAVIENAAAPIGTPVGAALDQAAVQKKAAQFPLDLVKDDWTLVTLNKAWKSAAKTAGWDAAQISALNDILKTSAGVNSMIETLRPFVIAAAPVQATHAIERTSPKGGEFRGTCRLCGAENLTSGDALKPCPNPRGVSADDALLQSIDPDLVQAGNFEVPILDCTLSDPTQLPLEKITQEFRFAAIRQAWPADAINAVVAEAERQARVIGDEPEATVTAMTYLRNFCVSK